MIWKWLIQCPKRNQVKNNMKITYISVYRGPCLNKQQHCCSTDLKEADVSKVHNSPKVKETTQMNHGHLRLFTKDFPRPWLFMDEKHLDSIGRALRNAAKEKKYLSEWMSKVLAYCKHWDHLKSSTDSQAPALMYKMCAKWNNTGQRTAKGENLSSWNNV